ncbi:protein of unknown function [Arachidicoccus rhizosphaerae]|uniref:FecR protein n=1 Tax=Arachidicoccus rhizosphaerae TaxID=551991 RepID=A0A1H4AYC9_9BACT|nr:FecR family protein [Arachidicoccus rhizosphaerae]SEA40879.1 protein of unknown function [Arachidicoccus rhizosphaerae]
MDNLRLKSLLLKYINDELTSMEEAEFFELVSDPAELKRLRAIAEKLDITGTAPLELAQPKADDILSDILGFAREPDLAEALPGDGADGKAGKKRSYRRIAAAAIVCGLVLGGGWLWRFSRPSGNTASKIAQNLVIQDAMPGHTGAVLTLSTGKTYLLDTAANGLISPGIRKADQALNVTADAGVYEATLETPYGSVQQLVLSDGTKVWLNAGSTLHFPSAFRGSQRRVELNGEAYFEVVHNEKQPFVVVAGADVIQDLGTHFDVNAYCDEPSVKTTLLEGSVRIGAFTLSPGQQYQNGKISRVNAGNSIAWVSGFFHFENADLYSVMRELGRWYNVDVRYEGQMGTQKFEGDLQRSLKLSQVLKLIAGMGIHYTLNGQVLTIRS